MHSPSLPRNSDEILVVERINSACVITILVRELDTLAAEQLATELVALAQEPRARHFVLNFENVRFMESSCFGALVTFLKELTKVDGKIALTNVTENVRFLFTVTKLDKVFPIYPDAWTALQTFTNWSGSR